MKRKRKSKKSIRHHMRNEHYPARALAIVLLAVMFLEGMVFGVTTADDVMVGIQVLDMSTAMATTKADVVSVFEPMVNVVTGIDQFYHMAAAETYYLLEDNIVNNLVTMVEDINKFYDLASQEFTYALDFSESASAYSY